MNVREMLKEDFGVDLPIKGGFGNSIDNPVILIKEGQLNDYVAVEYSYLKYIGFGRRITWETLGQELITHGDRKIDKIKIKTRQPTETGLITQVENYYFDITDVF